MRRELFYLGGKGAIVQIPRGFNAKEWCEAQVAFGRACKARHPDNTWVEMRTLYPDQCISGVYYSEVLAGAQGMNFELLKFPETQEEDLKKCRARLKRDRDVVTISILRVDQWIDFEIKKDETT